MGNKNIKRYLSNLTGTDKQKLIAVAYRARAEVEEKGHSLYVGNRRILFHTDGAIRKIIDYEKRRN